jgi:hypothetical protein
MPAEAVDQFLTGRTRHHHPTEQRRWQIPVAARAETMEPNDQYGLRDFRQDIERFFGRG